MKKHTMLIIIFLVIFSIFFTNNKVFAENIPQKLGEVKYFLKGINTPFWIWFFRISFFVCMLGIIISLFYYQRKDS